VFAEPVPRLLQSLQDIPLGDALLDSPRQDRGRALAVDADRFVRGEQRDTISLQIVLDLGAVVRPTCDAFDRLADDRIESAVGRARLGEQILDSAVARYWDLERSCARE
jgi:hypothetical protein